MNEQEKHDDAASILKQVVTAMQDKKAKEIVSLDLSDIPNGMANFFVICHAPSKTQVGAIYDNIVEMVTKNCGIHPFHREGYENSEWILIDYFDVVAHVFLEDTRSFYSLESLWADAKRSAYESDRS